MRAESRELAGALRASLVGDGGIGELGAVGERQMGRASIPRGYTGGRHWTTSRCLWLCWFCIRRPVRACPVSREWGQGLGAGRGLLVGSGRSFGWRAFESRLHTRRRRCSGVVRARGRGHGDIGNGGLLRSGWMCPGVQRFRRSPPLDLDRPGASRRRRRYHQRACSGGGHRQRRRYGARRGIPCRQQSRRPVCRYWPRTVEPLFARRWAVDPCGLGWVRRGRILG